MILVECTVSSVFQFVRELAQAEKTSKGEAEGGVIVGAVNSSCIESSEDKNEEVLCNRKLSYTIVGILAHFYAPVHALQLAVRKYVIDIPPVATNVDVV